MNEITRKLIVSLKEVLRALESHLDESCRDHNLKQREDLCPCQQNEVKRAKELLNSLQSLY